MALSIERQDGNLYTANVTPPHGKREWVTPTPLPLRALIHELQKLGCHQQDIGDELYIIDPKWEEHL
jgi:hypothetical protein